VAAPVLDRRGTCVAAISVTGLKLSLSAGGIEGIGQIVRRYAAEISAKMGAGEDAATHKPIGPP
jgi:DNA-binding IclR family transcriptional regulator